MKTLISPGVVQVMIDMETLDVRPNSRILSVAAVPFCLDAAEEIDFLMGLNERGLPGVFYEHVELPLTLGVTDTLKWHLKTGTGAIEASASKGIPLDSALAQLHFAISAWAPEKSDYYIWGWGYGFDMTILAETYHTRPPNIWRSHTYRGNSGSDAGNAVTKRPLATTVGNVPWVLPEGANGDKLVFCTDDVRNAKISPNLGLPNYELPYWLKCYWRIIDARSVFLSHGGFWQDYAATRRGQHHDALDDAKHQIRVVQQVYGVDA